jgi:hypothetical protein
MPLPPTAHPIWEKLMTRKVKQAFSLFAANMAVDNAARQYARVDASERLNLAKELHEFFAKYEKFTAAELERLL